MLTDITYLENSDIYLEVLERMVAQARRSIWIATANVKLVKVRPPHSKRSKKQLAQRRMSIVRLFERLARKKIEIRLLHAAPPSGPFRKHYARSNLDKLPFFEMRQCPRVHLKTVIVDHRTAYFGSANLTGAGMGYRDERLRNFEIGATTTDGKLLEQLETFFDFIWRGEMCQDCGRKKYCPKPIKS